MKLTPSATAALVAAVLGLGSMAPAAIAQDSGPEAAPRSAPHTMMLQRDGKRLYMQRGDQRQMRRGQDGMQRHLGYGGGHGLLALACSPRGADRLDRMLQSLSQHLSPTAEQQSLFDQFRAEALTAQTAFADSCAGLRPEDATADSTGLVDRLKSGLELQQAHLTAMNEIMPSLEAFYDSLTDAQKALLEPRRGPGRGHHGWRSRQPAPGN